MDGERDFLVYEDHVIEYLEVFTGEVEVLELMDAPPGEKGDKGDQGIQGPIGETLIIFGRDNLDPGDHGEQVFRFPYDSTIVGISGYITTAPEGNDVVLDLNLNFVSVFADQSDRPRILSGEHEFDEIPLDIAAPKGSVASLDIDEVGSTIAGANLSAFVRYEKV
jgi:hypothetical protein